MSSFILSWALTLNHTLLLLAIILIILDFFIATDILTHIAYIILAYLVASNVQLHFMYQIIIGLGCWFVIVTAHYLFFRKFVQRLINRKIAPDKYRSCTDGLVGMTGQIKEIEQQKMIILEGDLWPIDNPEGFQQGQNVEVVEVKDGILTIKYTLEG